MERGSHCGTTLVVFPRALGHYLIPGGPEGHKSVVFWRFYTIFHMFWI